jgi:hypothetical protein
VGLENPIFMWLYKYSLKFLSELKSSRQELFIAWTSSTILKRSFKANNKKKLLIYRTVKNKLYVVIRLMIVKMIN